MKQLIVIFLGICFFQNINAQTYNLLGNNKPFTSIASESDMFSKKGKMNMKFPDLNMEMDGKINKMIAFYNDRLTVINENEVIIKFEKYSVDMEFELNGDITKDKEKMAIQGKEATFVKVRDKWSLKNPKKFSVKRIEELNYIAQIIPSYFYTQERLFPKSVQIEDTWKATDDDLIPIIGTGKNPKGTATLKLISVEEINDDQIATIEIVTEYTANDDDGTVKMKLEGIIKRSIKNYDGFKLETTGTYEMLADIEESGMKIQVKMKGDCNSNQHRTYKFD